MDEKKLSNNDFPRGNKEPPEEFKPLPDKIGFCLNSRIWIGIYTGTPSTCPNEEECESCGYYEEREPTKYLQRKWKMIWKWFA